MACPGWRFLARSWEGCRIRREFRERGCGETGGHVAGFFENDELAGVPVGCYGEQREIGEAFAEIDGVEDKGEEVLVEETVEAGTAEMGKDLADEETFGDLELYGVAEEADWDATNVRFRERVGKERKDTGQNRR